MMRRTLPVAALVCVMSLVGSSRADAGFWDWLEELNGPGPSTGHRPPFMANIFCGPSQGMLKGFLHTEKEPKNPSTCVFVDYHAFKAPDDSRFYPVESSILEFGTSARVHATTEIGAAIGRMSFSSRNTDIPGSPEIEGHRFVVSFPRVVFKPLLAIPHPAFENEAAWGFLQLYFKHTIIKGELNETHFASKPGTQFERTNQRVESVGFLIDLTALGNLIRRR
jgi:hypothetical protein